MIFGTPVAPDAVRGEANEMARNANAKKTIPACAPRCRMLPPIPDFINSGKNPEALPFPGS